MLKKLETSAHTFTEFGGFQSRSFWPQIILYRNLGGAPSTAASFATVLVMVCNTPLAKMQKKASLEDYGSQGCKNQSEFRNFEEYESVEAEFMAIQFLKNLLHLMEINDPDGELVRLDIMHSGGLVVFAEGLIHEMGSLYAHFSA
nr:hypothetical protein CFP56_53158 [Quercus suber]